MGVRCLRVAALCFAAASASASMTCGDDEQCSKEQVLLQAKTIFHAAHTPLEEKRWRQAVHEEGLETTSISDFGRSVPKFPRSVVTKLRALRNSTPKRHTYNFMGRLRGTPTSAMFDYGFAELTRRAWVIPFVLRNFSDHDFLKMTDPKKWFNKSLGKYDHSSASRVRPGGQADSWYDIAYFSILAASNFTLCPGGDTPWSVRTYEAALMGSICLIRDPAQDWDPAGSKAYTADGRKHMARLWEMYRYQRLDEPRHVYHQDKADHNFHVFIKYQTFIEGDNTPPRPGGDSEI